MRFKSVARALTFAATLLGFSAFGCSTANAGEITVYTSLEEAEIAEYLAIAKKDMPDLRVNILRLSTGDLGARILSEGKHPHYDAIWGWALTNMLDPRIQSLLAVYQPKGSQRMSARFKDTDGKWFAPTGFMAALCVNTKRIEEKGLPMPNGWTELVNPVYKNELVMPNPISSGTGYLQVVSILQGMGGGERGWNFIRHLNRNVAQYTKSGSRPCNLASTGEYAIGASSALVAMDAIKHGYPVKMVIPREGAGYELEANALSASASHKQDAERFLDWTISDSVARVYGKYKEIVGIEGIEHDADLKKALFRMDFKRSMQTRSRTLIRWQREIERH